MAVIDPDEGRRVDLEPLDEGVLGATLDMEGERRAVRRLGLALARVDRVDPEEGHLPEDPPGAEDVLALAGLLVRADHRDTRRETRNANLARHHDHPRNHPMRLPHPLLAKRARARMTRRSPRIKAQEREENASSLPKAPAGMVRSVDSSMAVRKRLQQLRQHPRSASTIRVDDAETVTRARLST